jgi:hypothetical protein
MVMESDRDTVFILTREDVIECARELNIPEEEITDEVLQEIKKGVDWGMEFWSDVVKEAIRIAIERRS